MASVPTIPGQHPHDPHRTSSAAALTFALLRASQFHRSRLKSSYSSHWLQLLRRDSSPPSAAPNSPLPEHLIHSPPLLLPALESTTPTSSRRAMPQLKRRFGQSPRFGQDTTSPPNQSQRHVLSSQPLHTLHTEQSKLLLNRGTLRCVLLGEGTGREARSS